MAIRYVDSNVSSSGDGSSWGLAKKTLLEGIAITSAGDDIIIAHNHAEVTTASVTYTVPGTAAAPVRIICVNSTTGEMADTATVTAGASFTLTLAGTCHSIGVTYFSPSSTGITVGSANSVYWKIENGGLRNTYAASNPLISIGNGTSSKDIVLALVNSEVGFAHASGRISMNGGRLIWQDSPNAIVGTIPTGGLIRHFGLFSPLLVELNGLDLSPLGVNPVVINTTQGGGLVVVKNCKLAAGNPVVSGNALTPGGLQVEVINCDSGDSNYTLLAAPAQGSIVHETGIYRVGGFSDGTTTLSLRYTSGTNCSFVFPLELPTTLPIVVPWNGTPGSPITLEVHTLTNGVTLTDRDIWLEARYLGTSGFPLGNLATDRAGQLATATDQDVSSESWAGVGYAGITTPVKQKLSVTLTPTKKYPILLNVKLARPNTAVLVCPRAVVS